MKISKQTILLLGALVVLAVGSNLDAAGLKPDRGKGGGTRGKGGSQKKDFQKSAKNAVKALTARIRTDFNLQKGGGPQKFLEAVENGNVSGFTLPNPLNFANVQNHSSFDTIKTAAGDIREQIKLLKADLAKPETTDARLNEIDKEASSPNGALYKQYLQFYADFKEASKSPEKVKTADEAKAEAVADFKSTKTMELNAAKADAPTTLKKFTAGSSEATALTQAKTTYDEAVSDAQTAITGIAATDLELTAGTDATQKNNYSLTVAKNGAINTLITSVKAAAAAFKDANEAVEAKKGGPIDIQNIDPTAIANLKTIADVDAMLKEITLKDKTTKVFAGSLAGKNLSIVAAAKQALLPGKTEEITDEEIEKLRGLLEHGITLDNNVKALANSIVTEIEQIPFA